MNLTPRQKEVFDFIQGYLRKHGHSPSHSVLMQHFKWKSFGTVQDILNAIQKRGYLSRDHATAHSIELHTKPNKEKENELPILGKVAAGRPLEHYKYDEKMFVPPQMLKGSGDFFMLEISGDSMIDEGILDGDKVVVKKSSQGENGQIVVAFVEDGATIKTFYKKKTHIELHSANSKYQPIIVKPHQDFRIEGLYCGLIRY